MILDLRFPVGLLFTLIGVVLAAFGYSTNSNATLYTRSLGINVNIWWGIVLLIFGQILFHIGRRAQLRLTPPPAPSPKPTRVKKQ